MIPPPALEAQKIEKRFGAVRALKGVDLSLRPGEVHALLGENGAGKSTLMNILFGLIVPDGGTLLRDGQPMQFRSPQDAMAAGIGMVHQHFTLVPPFTVAENLSLGRTPGLFNSRNAAERVTQLCERVGLQVNPNARVGDLSVGEQQRVEILKALARDAEVLILDEPTGVLAPQEIDDLLALVRRLADGGTAIVFITHKLAEVTRIADRITVLRGGERTLEGDAKQFSLSDLARAMVGEERPANPQSKQTATPHSSILLSETGLDLESSDNPLPPSTSSEIVLQVENVSVVNDRRETRVRNVTFDLREGEVLGIAGVEGSGQSELAEAVTGLQPLRSGSIRLIAIEGNERDLSLSSPANYIDAGGAHIPEDRRRTGLALSMPIWENLILESHRRPPIRRGIWLDRALARRQSEEAVQEYEVRTPSIDVKASALSGGNQQKIVVAREMGRQPRLLVAVNPTRGLDIRAMAYVHSKIQEHREAGGATLLISSELDEILALSDRIAVMHNGQIVAFLPPDASREVIGLWMTRGAVSPASSAPEASTKGVSE